MDTDLEVSNVYIVQEGEPSTFASTRVPLESRNHGF